MAGPTDAPPARPGSGAAPRRAAWSWHHAGLRTVSMLGLVAAWQIAAVAVADPLLPSPVTVARTLADQVVAGDLLFHVGITLARVVASFVAAMLIGTVLGIVMGRFPVANRLLDPLIVTGLNIPALVVTVLCYLWFGLIEAAAVAAVALNKIPMVAVLVREGAAAVDRGLLEVAAVYRIPRHRAFLKAYLPQIYPSLMASARAGLALIWKIVLVVELLGRSNGVGFKLAVLFQYFDVAGILAYTAVFVGIMLAVEGLLMRPLERRMTGWRR